MENFTNFKKTFYSQFLEKFQLSKNHLFTVVAAGLLSAILVFLLSSFLTTNESLFYNTFMDPFTHFLGSLESLTNTWHTFLEKKQLVDRQITELIVLEQIVAHYPDLSLWWKQDLFPTIQSLTRQGLSSHEILYQLQDIKARTLENEHLLEIKIQQGFAQSATGPWKWIISGLVVCLAIL